MKHVITVCILILIVSSIVIADSTDNKQPLTNVNDGPYVFIEDDSTIMIQYVLNDSMVEFEKTGENVILFDGIGFDSLNSYQIQTEHKIAESHIYSNVSKLFAFSDIHGEYEFLCDLLINNKIVDSSLHWSFGDGHVVVIGDMTDRGDRVTEILWLIYRLETEAVKAGGRVHFVLGNHEMMVLQNDLRYLHDKYSQATTAVLGKTQAELFDKNTVLGDWLRTKNICEIINGMLFVHAGVNPTIIEKNYSLEFINSTMRANIDTPRDSIKADSSLNYLFRGFGPIWYRGYHYDMEKYKQANEKQVDALLDYFAVSNIIVGHTVLDSVGVLYNGKILGVNQNYEVREEIEGLFWSDNLFFACDIYGARRQLIAGKQVDE